MRNISSKNNLILLLTFVVLFSGFTTQVQSNESTDWFKLLVENQQLVDHLGDQDLVILDVRTADEYMQGHITGAVNLPVDKTFRSTNPTYLVGSLQKIQALMRTKGINNNSAIVVYDNGRLIDAARVFWVLEVYGQEHVAILNGGFALWATKYKISTQETIPVSGDFVPNIKPEKLTTKLSARLAIEDNNKVILDSRPDDHYYGKVSRASRFGHIPSAISSPADNNFITKDGLPLLKTTNELRPLYSNLDKNKKIITYCNVGKRASLSYFVLRNLGFDVSHYDGSWLEWGNDESLPIATDSQ